MKQSIFVVTLGLCVIGLSAAGPYDGVDRPQPPKASATVDLLPGIAKVIVHITNESEIALEAWQIHLEYDMAGGLSNAIDITTDTCFDSADAGTPGRGPIPPRGRRDLTFAVAGVPLKATAALRMLLFTDLSSEGNSDEVSFILEQRELHARTLSVWIDVLQAVLGKTPEQIRTELQKTIASENRRLELDPADSRAMATKQNIADLVASDNSPGLASQVARVRQQFELQRARALRHRAR